eukprot:CAMPEP_0168829198 /NCGR_PEP_ID=MMETSP0727-20121128/898_1 /TAXON_ID=265536 /ORGANISM="Amphiprora sp., Strain CCMP467" /LENGTH=779 /DNA_ID=CAMNT_0008882403 /DNA_START=3521 /DNA_END=5860 /DNA_ORIENTATION=+
MGKKKGKKVDLEKKAALQAKKEAKQEKAARKRLTKEARGGDGAEGGDSDAFAFEALLQQYKATDRKEVQSGQAEVVALDGFPLARANASLTLYEDAKKKNAELFLFGGEYYDGIENIVLDHLLKYDLGKNEWKRINTTNPTPLPRCAHSCVYYNHAFYVFGGEKASADQYYHYKDLWRYDIKLQKWEEIKAPKATGTHPTARSGHTAVVWKHYMVIFGGFYEATKDTSPRWYNDVYVMDLQTNLWLDIPHSKLTSRPEPRSACNSAVIDEEDCLIVHGGFSKLSKGNSLSRTHANDRGDATITSETKVHNDTWVLRLKPILSNKPPSWERLTSSVQRNALRSLNSSPDGRAGTASVAFKNRMVSFGGVVDAENLHHKLNSVFYADLFAFDIERRKWFPIHINKSAAVGKGGKRRRRKTEESTTDEKESPEPDYAVDDEDEDEDNDDDEVLVLEEEEEGNSNTNANSNTGWDLDKLRSNMFAFIDGEGNVVYEKIDDSNSEGEANEEEEEEEEEEQEEEEKNGNERKEQASLDPAVPKPATGSSEVSKNAGQVVASSSVMVMNPDTQKPEAVHRNEPLPRIKSTLVIVGTTLYVYGGLLEVGDREVTLDDLWCLDLKKRAGWTCIWQGTMHKQVWRGAIHDDDDSYYSSSAEKAIGDDDDDDDDDEFDVGKTDVPTALKTKDKRSQIKAQIKAIIEQYKMSNERDTPAPGENLADFYSRTSDYWNQRAGSNVDTKDSKREGFAFAQARYEELGPAMKELKTLDRLYKDEKNKEKKGGKSS